MMIEQLWIRPVSVLAAGTFVVATDAQSVAGLLPRMAASLHTSVGVAGQSVTVFAIAYAVLSPVLTTATARRGARTILLAALVVFAVGNVVTALAPNLAVLLAGRVVAAGGAALFTPNAGATAARLAGPERRGTALALVTAGSSSALVLGSPAGAALAAVTDWRTTVLVIAGLGLLMTVPLLATRSLPSAPARHDRARFGALRAWPVRSTLAVSTGAFAGVFVPYTYLSQSYAPLARTLPGGIATVLLLFGLTSVLGALTSGPLSDRLPARWLVVGITAALALVDAVAVVGRSSTPLLIVTLLLAGFLSWSILTPQQHLLVAADPGRAAVLISFNAAASYLGIGLAGWLGANALAVAGPAHFGLLATGLLLAAAAWRAAAPRPRRRTPAGTRKGGVLTEVR